MPRGIGSQSQHDRLVKAMANMFEGKGYQVKADLDTYQNKPSEWAGHRPDVEAIKNGLINKRILVEVETCDSLDWPNTQAQWQAFSSMPNTLFFVAVPSNCVGEAREKITQLNVKVDQLYSFDL